MGVEESRKGQKGGAKQVNWEEFGETIANNVLEEIEYFCAYTSGMGDALTCYYAHSDLPLYDLAREFVGSPHNSITKRDLYLLRKMPENIYEKYDKYVRKEIERITNKLIEDYRQFYRLTCEERCGDDEECIEDCIEGSIKEHLYGSGP